MSALPASRSSIAEYLQLAKVSAEKLEYYHGTIVAQAGASARHNTIVANLIAHLLPQLRRQQCQIYPGDLRVQALSEQVYTYPDATIVCGRPQFAEPGELTLLNPAIIFEVLSPTTERYDRSEKLVYYRSIASLQEYILISQSEPYVQRYTRQTAHFWYVHLIDSLDDVIQLSVGGCALPVAEIYAGVELGGSP